MLRNYFKTAFRNLAKNKLYSTINIIGLSVSLTAAILLLLWVWDELSFDRMHSKSDRVYSVAAAIGKGKDQLWGTTSAPLAFFGKNEVPAIEDACRISVFNRPILLEYQDKRFNETQTYVDPSFFHLFDFKLVDGNRNKPFPDNRSIILSESIAKKYFGNQPAVGKTLQVKDGDAYKVTGVMVDMPKNSSLQYNLLMPFDILGENRAENPLNTDWGNFNYQTFFLLKAGSNPALVGKQLADIHRKNQQSDFWKDLNYLLEPLTNYHLYAADGTEQGMKQVKIFAFVAFIILVIACINYINLVTARSSRRSKEVSVRKVVGAGKKHLFWQFISESFIIFLIAVLFSIALSFALMPLYNSLSGKEMIFSLFDYRVWAIFGTMLLIILLLAGVYPALMLSSFNPTLALKGILPKFGKSNSFRQVLVVIQFTCSVVLIVATLIISKQLTYIRTMNLGYSKENVFSFPGYAFSKKNNREAIRQQLEQQPGIIGVTSSSQSVLDLHSSTGDLEWEGKPANMSTFIINQLSVDRTFPKVMDLQFTAGRGFSGTAADSSHYILNETAIKQMGLTNAVGKPITFHDQPGTIVGIVKDFHLHSLHEPITPLVICFEPQNASYILIRTQPGKTQQAVDDIQRVYTKYESVFPFEYHFMDELYEAQYKNETIIEKLGYIFALLTIFIACLGLFGLAAFSAQQRTKEIGIRKVLGASVIGITQLLSKDFLKLVLIGLVIATPIAWWVMTKWLEGFAYRIDISWWIFTLAGLAALLIALLTVSWQAIRAAMANPVESLRDE